MDRVIGYDFCLGIPDEIGCSSRVLINSQIEGLWKEKELYFESDEEAIEYATEKGYPYFDKIFIRGGERYREPFFFNRNLKNHEKFI